jgi:hypothetical protein
MLWFSQAVSGVVAMKIQKHKMVFLILPLVFAISFLMPAAGLAATQDPGTFTPSVEGCHPSDPNIKLPPDVKKACSDPCHPEWHDPAGEPLTPTQSKSCQSCNGQSSSEADCIANNALVKDIQAIVNVMSAGVGIVVVGAIIFAGIQYSFAGDNPTMVSKAKHRILNAIIALLIFLLLFAFVQWLVPGGVFS